MLVGETPADVAGVLDLRDRLLTSMLPQGLSLSEGGAYRPHVTLTTGLSPEDARRLESKARGLDLRFTAHEIVFWSGGEITDSETAPDPPWRIVERLFLT